MERVDQQRTVGRVEERTPEALHKLQNKDNSWLCMLMKWSRA